VHSHQRFGCLTSALKPARRPVSSSTGFKSHAVRSVGRVPPLASIFWPTTDHVFWLLEYMLAVLGLLLCSRALVWIYGSAGDPRSTPLDEPNILFQIISGSIYLLALAFILPRWRDAALVLARNKALLLLRTIAAISFLWAVDSAVALRRALALLLSFGFALWLAMRFSPRVLLGLTVAALLLGTLASIATALLVPEIGRHIWDNHAGLWRGVFGHKNIMGRMMSFAVVAGLLLLITGCGSRLPAVVAVGLEAPLVVMSGSATAGASTLLI
jgi:exopolysaccharide production protein ExoQ